MSQLAQWLNAYAEQSERMRRNMLADASRIAFTHGMCCQCSYCVVHAAIHWDQTDHSAYSISEINNVRRAAGLRIVRK